MYHNNVSYHTSQHYYVTQPMSSDIVMWCNQKQNLNKMYKYKMNMQQNIITLKQDVQIQNKHLIKCNNTKTRRINIK